MNRRRLNRERASRYARYHGRTPPWKTMDTTAYLLQDKVLLLSVKELKAGGVLLVQPDG